MSIEVNGVPLNTLAKSVESITGRLHVPAKRGTNRVVSGRSGSIRTKKRYDENTIVLPMWVQGSMDDGTVPRGGSALIEFQRNLDKLTQLFSADDLYIIERRADGSVREIHGEVLDAIDFTSSMQGLAKFSVSIVCSDPFWSDTSPTTTTLTNSSDTNLIQLQGSTAPIEDAIVRFIGPCTNPWIDTGRTRTQYNAMLTAGQSITINSKNWQISGGGGHTADYSLLTSTGDARLIVIPSTADPNGPRVRTGHTSSTTGWQTQITASRKYLVGY